MSDLDETTQPRDFEKWILAAYLRFLGEPLERVARVVQRTRKTIYSWRQQEAWWNEAKRIAEDRWLDEVRDQARAAVYQQVLAGDGKMGLDLLERLDPRLAPAKQRHDVDGEVRVYRGPKKAQTSSEWQEEVSTNGFGS